MPHGVVTGIIFALTPTIIVGLIFWFVMRAIIRADRTERATYAKIEAEERAKFAAERAHAGVASGTQVPSGTPVSPGTPGSPASTSSAD